MIIQHLSWKSLELDRKWDLNLGEDGGYELGSNVEGLIASREPWKVFE